MALDAFATKAANLRGEAGSGAKQKQVQIPALPPPHLVPLDSNLSSPRIIRLLGALNKVTQEKQLGQCLPQEKLSKQGSHSSLSSALCDLQPKDPPTKTEGGFLTGTEGGQGTDQEAGAGDGKALFVEVGAAEEQEHVGLMLPPVVSKDLGELPQLSQVRGEPQGPGGLEKHMET